MRKLLYTLPLMSSFVIASQQTMYGLVNLKNSDISQDLRVVGSATVNESNVDAAMKVLGAINASASKFGKGLDVVGSDIQLKQSLVSGDVTVTNYLKKPKIKLEGTTVDGQIVFNSLQPGEVIMDADSDVTKGIKNGVKQNG